MLWILYTNIGYFLFALSSLVDRFLLLGPLPQSSLYAFYIAALNIFALVLIPFGFSTPPITVILLALLTGFLSIIALWAWYEAIIRSEVSRVVPMGGALQPIFVLLISILFWGKGAIFSLEHWLPYILLISGGFFLASTKHAHRSNIRQSFLFIIIATFLFALTFVLTKYLLGETSFMNMIIWTRFGTLLSIPVLILGGALKAWKHSLGAWKKMHRRTITIVTTVQTVSLLGSLLVLYAISIAPIAQIPFINAMFGGEFIFLYIIAYFLHQKYPQLLQEKMRGVALYQKIFAISLIILGYILLAVLQ